MSEPRLQLDLSPAIGLDSTGSQTRQSEPLSNRWATALGKLHLTGQMLGIESIRRSLKREDDLADLDARANHAVLHGSRTSETGTPQGDDMGHLVLGDMRTEHHYHQPPDPPKNGIGTVGKLALAAALMTTGVGVGAAIPLAIDALSDRPVPQVQPEPETRVETRTERKVFDYEIGEPIVE